MKTRISSLFIEFLKSEQASGVILLFTAVISLMISNSALGTAYQSILHTEIGIDAGYLHLRYDLAHWINEGLMAVFFLLIGLEIERELYIGELSSPKNAVLPIMAAFGGMLIPTGFYLLFNYGRPTENGFGIPMATDIAFALGAVRLLGNRVPTSVKIFLAALAIIDDLGSILVIALFYAGDFSINYFILAMLVFAGLMALNRLGVDHYIPYILGGVLMWYLMLQSGIHASIAGVLLAFAIPFRDGNPQTPSAVFQRNLNEPVAFFVMPVFAMANTGVVFAGIALKNLLERNALGIISGLSLGKPLGIVLFSLLGNVLRLGKLPQDMNFKHLLGVGFLGGIGFTMSIFITILAFDETSLAQTSKIAIMIGSLISGLIGLWILSRNPLTNQSTEG